MIDPPKSYYKERDFTPCPKPERREERVPPPRIRLGHKALNGKGIPRKKDGCRLGLRKRIASLYPVLRRR